jgi:16S rRNA (uracil1498-N3)-methyltransferase
MQLFYNRYIQPNEQEFTFDKTESKHMVRVLRKKEGDVIYITNGKGHLFTAKIALASDRKCSVNILKVEEKPKTWSYHLHIAIAPTKSNDRFEWFLEKATEIGIDEITPIICDHSERKVLKIERIQKIVEAAAKQSLKFHFPILNTPTTFKEFIDRSSEAQTFIAHCVDGDKALLNTHLKHAVDLIILIGPEGDFSTAEIKMATAKNYIPVSLGKSRLRTETAGIVAAHSVSLFHATA